MKNFTRSFLRKHGLAASIALFAFNAHAQVTDQAVVEAFPDLTDGTFVIGATGAYDVDTNEDVTLHAVNTDSSLTLQNGSNYTSNNHDILLASWYRSAATLNITGGIIDLGSGYIMADRDDDDGRASEAPAYVNITGGTVNLYGFRAYNHLWGGGDVAVEVPSTLHVNISGQGTSVSSNEPVSLSSSFEGTVNITVSDGAVYSMPNDDHVDSFSIESGGTLESRGSFSAANLNFASGGTLKFGGVGYYIDSISSGQTIVLDGGAFYDTTTLAGGTLKTGAFDMNNLSFTSGTLEATGTLTNLDSLSSSAQTVILDGGIWSPSGNIETGNVTLQNSGELTLDGDYDATNFTFTSGTLETSGVLTHLDPLSSGQTVILNGGSFGDTTTLDGGTVKTTSFDMSNLTFNSGTLEATGTLTNLGTLSSGDTVILDGGSFGDATTLAGGTVKITDFDMTNLLFTSGTLEATGTLQNLTEVGVNQTVTIDGASANLLMNQNTNVTGGTLNVLNGASVSVLNHTFTVFNGDLLFSSSGGTVEIDGGTLNVGSLNTALTLNENSSITGNGTLFGDVNLGVGGSIDGDVTGLTLYGDLSGTGTLSDVTVYGNVDIGNSPGVLELQGVTLASGTVFMEIFGTGVGEYDTLIGDAFTDVSGAILNISFVGFTPLGGESWQLISGGIDPSSFNSVSTPENYAMSGDGSFTAIPEPSTWIMLGGLVLSMVICLRRRQ